MKKKLLLALPVLLILLFSCDDAVLSEVVEHLILPTPVIIITPQDSSQEATDSDEYYSSQLLSISCEEEATIHYKLYRNGELVDSGIYSEPLVLGGPMNRYQISAYAERDGRVDSKRASRSLSVLYSYVDAPTFSLEGDTYNADQELEILCSSVGAEIYYTLDSSDPRTSDSVMLFEEPIEISGHNRSVRIKAFARLDGYTDSPLADDQFRIEYPQLSPPVLSQPSGTYAYDLSVTISPPVGAPESYQIYYTVDQQDPDSSNSDQLYSGDPISITGLGTQITLRTLGYAPGYQLSSEALGTYMIGQNQTDEPQGTLSGDLLQFQVGDGSDDSILIYCTVGENGAEPIDIVTTGHTDPLPASVDQQSYTIGGVITVYKLRNGSSLDLSGFTGAVKVNALAIRRELNPDNPESVASDPVIFGPYNL